MSHFLIISEKCSKECLGEGLVFNGVFAIALIFYFSNIDFIRSFETELLGFAILAIVVGLLLKFWFRSLNVFDIRSGELLKGYGNRFFYKKEVLLKLSDIQLLRLRVDSYFSSLSTRHIKINLLTLDKINNYYLVAEGSDKFWKLLYSSILISKNFQIPLESDADLNDYLRRINLPMIYQNNCEITYRSKAFLELIINFLIWCGIALAPFMVVITILIAVGPRLT